MMPTDRLPRSAGSPLWLLGCFILFAFPLAAQQTNSVETLGWFAGCWRQVGAGTVVDEVWLLPAGGTLVGMSRTVRADSTRAWEHLVIRTGPSGLVYQAAPSGQPPAEFVASQVSDTLALFENPNHDFPQQIRYTRRGVDSLVAIVSGTVRERTRAIQVQYGRVACPGQ